MRRSKDVQTSTDGWSLSDFGSFYVQYRGELHAHAYRILKDSSRADEVVQDAFIRVLLAAPELNSIDHARSYLHRTIENLCMDLFRIEGRRPNLVLVEDVLSEVDLRYQDHLDLADSVAAADDAALIRQALSLLSPAERAALVMWEMEGRSTKEIAAELGIKEKSVRHTLSRARASLRRVLSNFIIDEARGLTALDMISSNYARAAKLARKSSKVALTLLLVFSLFTGYNSFLGQEVSPNSLNKNSVKLEGSAGPTKLESEAFENFSIDVQSANPSAAKSVNKNAQKEIELLSFPGLDDSGIPTGFTVADSSGNFGTAYFRTRSEVNPVSYASSAQIFKTRTGAANVLIVQTLTSLKSRFDYIPVVSFGKEGEWVPLLVSVQKSQISRLQGGNYLLTVSIAVDSAIESPIKVEAEAYGRDLETAPTRVIVRIVLDRSKTDVLAQAVYVEESESGA